MSLPSVLTNNLKKANRAQRVYMQTVAAHAFFQNFIAEIYGYTVLSAGLGVAKGVIPEMLMDDASVTVTHPGNGKVFSLAQMNRRLRTQGESVLGPSLLAFPVSRTDPLFHHQREQMALAWDAPIEFCNTYVNAVARGIDNRYSGNRETRDAVVASAAYSSYQYLSAMLPAFVDHFKTAEDFVDTFIAHANDPEKDTASWSWPVTFNNALLQTLFSGAEFGDPMELYRIYSNLVNTSAQAGESAVAADTIKDAMMFTALGRVIIGPAV